MHSTLVRLVRSVAVVGTLALSLVVSTGPANASGHDDQAGQGHSRYVQTNLVADTPGKAQVTDPNLVNPWGVSYGLTTPLWVSNNGTGTSTLYAGGIHGGTQTVNPLVVTIPGGGPTGQVFNPTTDFVVHGSDGSSAPARFIFVGVTGHLTGWAPNVPARRRPRTPRTPSSPRVRRSPAWRSPPPVAVRVSTRPASPPVPSTSTTACSSGSSRPGTSWIRCCRRVLAVQRPGARRLGLRGLREDRSQHRSTDVFDFDGNLRKRIHQTSDLNAPWGMTIAPAGFGKLSGDLLVGNFGDGRIHAFNPVTLKEQGSVRNAQGRAIIIDGLWALTPGNGVEAGTDEVIFTAGPHNGMHGLLGTLSLR